MSASTMLGDFFRVRKEKGEAGLPTLSVTMNDGLVDRADLDRKMETNLAPEEHLRVREGDIAYNMMRMWQGAFGRAEKDGIVSPAYVVVEPRENLDSRFAAHWFKSARMIHLFWAYSYGLTEDRLRLYADDFCRIPAFPPDRPDQERLAAILDSCDCVADVIRSKLALLQRRKGELARRLLHEGGKRNGRLGDLAQINPRSPRVEPDQIVSFVPMEAMSEDGRLMQNEARPRTEIGTGYTGFVDEDILVAKITPCFENGKGGHVFGLHSGVGFGSTEFHVLRAHDKRDVRFLHHHVMARAFRKNGERYMTGSAGQRRVPAEFIEDYRVLLMDAERRHRAATILDAADREIDLLQQELRCLTHQKRALMQRLFSGDALTTEAAE